MKGLKVLFFSGTGKTLMARQIGKMLNTREPKIISGPGTDFNQNISLRMRSKRFFTSSLRKLERERNFWAIPISSETLSKDNNVRINVM